MYSHTRLWPLRWLLHLLVYLCGREVKVKWLDERKTGQPPESSLLIWRLALQFLCRYKSAAWFNYSIKPPPAINLHAKRCQQDWGFFDLLLHAVKYLTIQIAFCYNYFAKCRFQSSAHFITDSWGLDALR